MRIVKGHYLIGTVDTVLAAGVIVFGLYVWHTRKVRAPALMLTGCYMVGMIVVVYLRHCALVYWAFPTMTAAYFLVKPREVGVINIIALIALLPALLENLAVIEMSSILVTLVLNNSFFLFSRAACNSIMTSLLCRRPWIR